MDSLTQITLGAAIGEAVLGKKVGNKAALWGGICGTLPDLDSLIPYGEAVATVTYHRSFSHSIFVLILISPVMAWLIAKVHPDTQQYRREWLILVILALTTHPVLDCFTVYGTQILWPFYIYPVSWSTIFIIDPLYTLPLLTGLILSMSLRRQVNRAFLINYAGISLSCLYLSWTVMLKYHIDDIAVSSLKAQDIQYDIVMSTPAPLNTILWRVIARDKTGYYDGYYSIFDEAHQIEFQYYQSDESLLNGLTNHWSVNRLKWFTHGFYAMSQQGSAVLMTDLRMGMEPSYIFTYKVAERSNQTSRGAPSELLPSGWDQDQFSWIVQRIKQSIYD